MYDFEALSDIGRFNSLEDFYREVDGLTYQMSFRTISKKHLDELIRDGKLYLFQIYNKDFSPHSKGRPNLHTMYWKALFAPENLRDVVYKLNGEAKIFFRKRSIDEQDATVHPADVPIGKKNPRLEGQTGIFPYSITKDRRYTADKFQFHVPITMNYKASGGPRLNEKVCAYLKNNPDVNIIGIDRGERHLLYISMIDRNGRVVLDENGKDIQYSLNTVTGAYRDREGRTVEFTTPYQSLLDRREKERELARENWGTIETIKELKEGYLSQVVHHIASLMVKYNAIVVMEDLNSDFKRGRIKVEKQVYQKFEKALIEKLNYLVFKTVSASEAGGLYRACQLTEPFESFKKLTKQNGFLFYIPAWTTSKIDPVTGFVDLLKPKYTNIAAAQAYFGKFKEIFYDAQRDFFAFRFDYSDFTDTAEGARTDWTVCSVGALRYAYDRKLNGGRGGTVKWNATEKLKELFDRNEIDYRAGDLKAAIVRQDSAPFFVSLIQNLRVILAMRYSCTEDDKDFILSPVADQNGHFYCSEDAIPGLPQDADANGAYNIARKGLMVLRKIDAAQNSREWSTRITNKEWLKFAQNEG